MAKRKVGRTPAAYARGGPVREPYDYVLIVCEGKKTEPKYLQGLKAAHSLGNANIQVMHSGATDPMSIVRFAEKELAQDNEYDRAYCVFDRDAHQTYNAALQRARDSEAAKDGRLYIVTSVPCFEVWLLLHFRFSSSPFSTTGKLTAGEKALRELLKHWPSYTKGQPDAYEMLADRLETAIKHAKKLEAENRKNGSDNPATEVHHLVEYLRNLKKI
jgi:hypothetical protein